MRCTGRPSALGRDCAAQVGLRPWSSLHNRGKDVEVPGNVADLTDHYGVDQVRYFFLRAAHGQDGEASSHEAIVNGANADLANDFGNLAQRSRR